MEKMGSARPAHALYAQVVPGAHPTLGTSLGQKQVQAAQGEADAQGGNSVDADVVPQVVRGPGNCPSWALLSPTSCICWETA